MNLRELADRIKDRRLKAGLKQQDVANALGVSPQAVSKWERGENAPDIAVVVPLARLLGVTSDWLITGVREERDTFEATVFVSSVVGAYNMSLGIPPRDFAIWANGLFLKLTEATLRHGGVPIKYMGDQYLCFFSGAAHQERAVRTAFTVKSIVSEAIRIGLSSGSIYLGAIGHPDYARPDIMGEVVNAAFLILQWAENTAASGVAATAGVLEAVPGLVRVGVKESVPFRAMEKAVDAIELTALA